MATICLRGFFITGFEPRYKIVLAALQAACSDASNGAVKFEIDVLNSIATGETDPPGHQARKGIEKAAFVIADLSSRPANGRGWSRNVAFECGIAVSCGVPTRMIYDSGRMSHKDVPTDIPDLVFRFTEKDYETLTREVSVWLRMRATEILARHDSRECRRALANANDELSKWTPIEFARFGQVIKAITQRLSEVSSDIRAFRLKEKERFSFTPYPRVRMIDTVFTGCTRAMRPQDEYVTCSTVEFIRQLGRHANSDFHRELTKKCEAGDITIHRVIILQGPPDKQTAALLDKEFNAQGPNYSVRYFLPSDYYACRQEYHRGVFIYKRAGGDHLMDIAPTYAERTNTLTSLDVLGNAEYELSKVQSKYEKGKPAWRDLFGSGDGLGAGHSS